MSANSTIDIVGTEPQTERCFSEAKDTAKTSSKTSPHLSYHPLSLVFDGSAVERLCRSAIETPGPAELVLVIVDGTAYLDSASLFFSKQEHFRVYADGWGPAVYRMSADLPVFKHRYRGGDRLRIVVDIGNPDLPPQLTILASPERAAEICKEVRKSQQR